MIDQTSMHAATAAAVNIDSVVEQLRREPIEWTRMSESERAAIKRAATFTTRKVAA